MKKIIYFLLLWNSINLSIQAQIVLSESFDGTTFVPTGWQNNFVSGTGPVVRWDRVTTGTSPVVLPHSGAAMARFDCRTASSGYVVNLITPALNFQTGGPFRVRFWLYRGDRVALSLDELRVYVHTSAFTSGATELTRIFISRVKEPAEVSNGWYEYMYEIPSTYTGATNYIIFNAISRNNNVIYLDDITVESGNCLRPNSPVISGITPTSFQVNWTLPVSGPPAAYDYEIRSAGSCGTGSNGLALTGSISPPALTLPVTGLQQGYQYRLCIRSDCGADSSMWNYPVYAVTPCTATPVPYTQNFDGVISGTGLPPCITLDNADGSDSWRMNNYFFDASYTASSPGAIFTFSSGNSFGQPGNDWFFTAPVTLEAGKCYQLGFAYRTNTANESIEVKMGNTPHRDFMTTALFSRSNFVATTYQQQNNNITVTTTGTYYVGFRCLTNQGFGGGLFVDNISIKEICGVPLSLQVSNVSLAGVTFNWTQPTCGTSIGYDWELRSSGAPGSGAAGLAQSGSTGTGIQTATTGALVNGTMYTIYVRTRCIDGSNSSWTNGYTFKACGSVALPYFENFDNVVQPTIPDCYTIDNVNGGATWELRQSIQPYSAPNCMSYTSWATSAIGNDWLYTPPFNLVGGTTYRLTFYFGARSSTNTEILEVKAGPATNAAAMTSPVLFYSNAINNSILNQAIVDYTPAVSGNQHIGFHALSAGPQFFLKIDDVALADAPACDSVRQLKFTDITPYAAKANWQAPIINTVSSYEWELRIANPPGSGVSGLVQSGTMPSSSLLLNLTGLLPGQQYTLYIRSSCGATFGDWVPAILQTACLPVTPDYAETFDGVVAPAQPSCTKIESVKKDITWLVRNVSLGTAHSDPNILFYFNNPFEAADDWFYTAPLSLAAGNTYRLSFYYRADNSTFSEALEVKMGNYAQVNAMNTLLFSRPSFSNQTFVRAELEFTAPIAGTYYLGFHCYSLLNQGGVWLDDISVRSLGTCTNTPLVLQSARTGISYQWEIDSGSGFAPLTDNANYTGTATGTLNISGVPTSYYGYQYRCVVDGIPGDPYTLKFAAVWNGGNNTSWEDPTNWSACGLVPDQYTDVYVPAGKPRYPQVNNPATIRSLTAGPGASVTVQNGVNLTIIK